MSNTHFAPVVEAILRTVEEVDLNADDHTIGTTYRECVDQALDAAIKARGADTAQYMRTDGRDYDVIRDAVRAQQLARYVFEKVSQRCAVPYRDRDSILACAYGARSAALTLAGK